MIDQLRAKQIIPILISPTCRSEREAEEDEFVQHLLQWRGLLPATLRCYQRCVARFLRAWFADDPLLFDRLTPSDVIDFI
jgi:hypothetical protein